MTVSRLIKRKARRDWAGLTLWGLTGLAYALVVFAIASAFGAKAIALVREVIG